MDYCVYSHPNKSQNQIEQFTKTRRDLNTLENKVLSGMRNDTYSIFQAIDKEEGVGIQLWDILRESSIFVCDINMSNTIITGSLVGCRVLCMSDINIISGTGFLFADELVFEKTLKNVYRYFAKVKIQNIGDASPYQISKFESIIISTCLKEGLGDMVEYDEI